jgi:hypothetical protein
MTEQQLKKGLFRLWIFVSVINTCWVALELANDLSKSDEEFVRHAERWDGQHYPVMTESYTTEELANHFKERHQNDMIFLVIYGIASPIVVLLLGKFIFWVVKGFKKSD